MESDIFWSAIPWLGLEHLRLVASAGEIVLNGLVIAHLDGDPMRLHYEVRCTRSWVVRSVRVDRLDRGPGLALDSDGAGSWRHAGGDPIPALRGCLDVDLAITPATNTLPIRRFGLRPMETCEITAAYVRFPSLEVAPVVQRYTRLPDAGEREIYRYESGAYRTELAVDAEGVVLDYPGIWRRENPSPSVT